jgi:hypothetical protein
VKSVRSVVVSCLFCKSKQNNFARVILLPRTHTQKKGVACAELSASLYLRQRQTAWKHMIHAYSYLLEVHINHDRARNFFEFF